MVFLDLRSLVAEGNRTRASWNRIPARSSGQYRSFYYPQFSNNPITGCHIKLPMIGLTPINQHRPIPDGFKVKGVRVVSRARNTQWYVVVTIQCDVSMPETQPFGRAIGIDIGLENFLTTSDNFIVEPARFFRELQGMPEAERLRLR